MRGLWVIGRRTEAMDMRVGMRRPPPVCTCICTYAGLRAGGRFTRSAMGSPHAELPEHVIRTYIVFLPPSDWSCLASGDAESGNP